ncbi:MAG: hypothetical protein AB7G68_19510 [Nitrospiraceae bacterium]|jgi:hypothetical protein
MIMMAGLLVVGGILGLGVLFLGRRRKPDSRYRTGAQDPYRTS